MHRDVYNLVLPERRPRQRLPFKARWEIGRASRSASQSETDQRGAERSVAPRREASRRECDAAGRANFPRPPIPPYRISILISSNIK